MTTQDHRQATTLGKLGEVNEKKNLSPSSHILFFLHGRVWFCVSVSLSSPYELYDFASLGLDGRSVSDFYLAGTGRPGWLVTCLEHRFFWKEGQETKDPLSNLVSSTWNTEIKKTILSLPSQAPNEDWNNGSVNTRDREFPFLSRCPTMMLCCYHEKGLHLDLNCCF